MEPIIHLINPGITNSYGKSKPRGRFERQRRFWSRMTMLGGLIVLVSFFMVLAV